MWYIYIYNAILLSHKKTCHWVICKDVHGPRVCQTGRSESEREKQLSYIRHACGIYRNGTDDPSSWAGIEHGCKDLRVEEWSGG